MPKREREQEVAARFPKDVKNHVVTVALDNGVHRHLLCKEPGTFNRYFTITTWPGELCISGDMGTFVFNRLPDMFEFFRSDRGRINPQYWSEKLVAENRRSGYEEYSADVFRELIAERLKDWVEDRGLDDDNLTLLQDLVEGEVLDEADNGEVAAHTAARYFRFDGDEVFTDFWETNLREYTFHFLWCCHAIVWAIAQYDARVPEVAEVAHA